ncbi:hypothetical protein QBC39DRAFT_383274 [Podospora conica]|nr:hypothetical protein QBC39DRAFT_383274 [Schizothecium conicum]
MNILAPFAFWDSFMLGALAQFDKYLNEGAYDEQEGRAIYQSLAKSTIKIMHRPLLSGHDGKSLSLVDYQNLAALLNNCLKYQWQSLSESLIHMVVEQIQTPGDTEVSDMRDYWIPGFLHSLLNLLPSCETESSPQPGTPGQQASLQSLVQLIIRQYAHLLVGRTPLASVQDYWRCPVICTDHYKLRVFEELNSFLQSQQQARRFENHYHLESQIKGCEDCKYIEETSALLVVMKTAQTLEQRKAAWETKFAMARDFLAELMENPLQAKLKFLFGDRYSRIIDIEIGVRGLRNPFEEQLEAPPGQDVPIRPQGQVCHELGSNLPPSLVGTKRKAQDQGEQRVPVYFNRDSD